jgi:hypothetical protein
VRSAKFAAAFLALAAAAAAQEKKKEDLPRIIAVTPLHVVIGETQPVRLRGLKLKEVTEIRSTPPLTVTIKEKKDAAPPNGLEAKDVGDQELVVELSVPTDCSSAAIEFTAVAPSGDSETRKVYVIAKEAVAKEKEPNNGFSDAQVVDLSKPISGRIEPDKGRGCLPRRGAFRDGIERENHCCDGRFAPGSCAFGLRCRRAFDRKCG